MDQQVQSENTQLILSQQSEGRNHSRWFQTDPVDPAGRLFLADPVQGKGLSLCKTT